MANSQIGGALPAQMPPAAKTGVGKTDKAIAKSTSNRLLKAIKITNDPQLKATLSQALASLHQQVAQDTREAKKNQAPKVSAKAVPAVKPPKK